jgi:light-regulated signal transduction histidine kinase (bacteriophytochrome)
MILLAFFLIFSSINHFMLAILPWWPFYFTANIIQFLTAVLSVALLISIFIMLPEFFTLRTFDKYIYELEKRKIAEENLNAKNAEITKTNKDLEAFTYSISHDLRAPLRAISSYSRFLMEENLNQLDESGQHYIQNINECALKMETLISDLMRLSMISQKGLRYGQINLNNVINDVIKNIQKNYPDKYQVKVEDMPHIFGDEALIRQLLENLISNAFKYSHKIDYPVINIGLVRGDFGEAVFIKDNGTGFKMRYAEKIFKVFQRLHAEQQFEGTGVGMAIAKMIVEKHGGNIWAEGKINEGATFYFNIPNAQIN